MQLVSYGVTCLDQLFGSFALLAAYMTWWASTYDHKLVSKAAERPHLHRHTLMRHHS